MKKFFVILISFVCVLFLSSCKDSIHGETGDRYTVVETYMNDKGNVYILNNGWEVHLEQSYVQIYDENMNPGYYVGIHGKVGRLWQKVKVGTELELQKVYIESRVRKQRFLLPVKQPDYEVEKTIVKVNKYDGQLSKIDGKLNSGFLGNGSGNLHGEGMGSEDFFVNLYFEDGTSTSVSGKDNLRWLDVEVGDKVIEKRINNVIFYSPKM